MPPATELGNDDDPVVSEYDVFITPELEHQLYVLQYINRPPDLPFTKTTQSQPSEIRIKPQSGFVEVDIPINIQQNYNKPQGVRWGEALRKTKGFGQKAYGTAAGFERVMPRLSTRPGADAPATNTVDNDDNIDEYITNFEDANEKGHVLNTQTFGGQIMKDEGSAPSYMVGTFRNDQLHLTKLTGLVQMRTEFHYLDATAQLDAVNRRREKESQEGAKPTEPKAFLPQVKRSGGDSAAELTQSFFKSANQEKWAKLMYSDEDSQEAYDAYSEKLFLTEPNTAPRLRSTMNNAQYLDNISAPSKKRRAPRRKEDLVEISDDSDEEEVAGQVATEASKMEVD